MVSIDGAKSVLKPFFLRPANKAMYIREVAKECELSYERVQHYLGELEKAGALKSEKRGKIKEYALNRKHELVLKIFSLLEMERRQEFYQKAPKMRVWLQMAANELLAGDEVAKKPHRKGGPVADVKFILLFGSAARGEAKAGSDMDMLIVVRNRDRNFEKYVDETVKAKMEALTGKNFSMHVIKVEDFRAKWKKEPVYASLWLDRIVLYGDETFCREVLELGAPI